MGWIQDQVKRTAQSGPRGSLPASLELRADQKWEELVQGTRQDIDEYRALNGNAAFEQRSDSEIRVSNPESKIAVVVTMDMSAQNIHYIYQPEDEKTAVPEGGFLSLRTSNRSAELYSADERLTSEQARRLILEPLLFAASQNALSKTGT